MKEVPYIVFEGEMARLERIIKRQFILILVAICFLVGTNVYWIWYESQFQDVVTTTTQDVTQKVDADDGDATINDGVHINGNSDAEGSDEDHN